MTFQPRIAVSLLLLQASLCLLLPPMARANTSDTKPQQAAEKVTETEKITETVSEDTETGKAPDFPVSGPKSRAIQQATGFTPMTAWIGSKILAKEIKKKVDGDVRVQIRPYSALDMVSGKIYQLVIDGSEVVVDKTLPIKLFHAETDENTPLYVDIKKDPPLQRPISIKANATVTEENLNTLLSSEAGKKLLTHVKLTIPPVGEQYFDFIDPKIDFVEQTITLTALVNISGASLDKAIRVKAQGKVLPNADQSALELVDLAIDLENQTLPPGLLGYAKEQVDKLLNKGPIKVKDHDIRVHLQPPSVGTDELTVTATITVTPQKAVASEKP